VDSDTRGSRRTRSGLEFAGDSARGQPVPGEPHQSHQLHLFKSALSDTRNKQINKTSISRALLEALLKRPELPRGNDSTDGSPSAKSVDGHRISNEMIGQVSLIPFSIPVSHRKASRFGSILSTNFQKSSSPPQTQ
jgi:hypothetical protein